MANCYRMVLGNSLMKAYEMSGNKIICRCREVGEISVCLSEYFSVVRRGHWLVFKGL